LLATFFAFDVEGGLVCAPWSGTGASGGEGGASGCVRDELSCGDDTGAFCVYAGIATNPSHKAIAQQVRIKKL